MNNFLIYFIAATAFSLIAHLTVEWEFEIKKAVVQNIFVGIVFSWILTQSQVHKENKKIKLN